MAARRFGLLALLVLACSAHAQNIELLDQRYMTDLSFFEVSQSGGGGLPVTTVRRDVQETTTSEAPFSKTLHGAFSKTFATGTVDKFLVGTSTSAYPPDEGIGGARARADVESVLSFRTLQDVATPLQFSIIGSGFSFYSDGFFSLFDRSLGEYIFSYSWSSLSTPKYSPPPGSTPIPWTGYYQATVALAPLLLTSHVYELKLHASTNASSDSQYVSLGVTGLYPIAAPVPEPSQVSLALAGLIGVLLMSCIRRRCATTANG